MNIEFSTTSQHEAEKRLADPAYDWLTEAQKAYVVEHLGDVRVQDPMMYPSPRISIHGERAEAHRRAILLAETRRKSEPQHLSEVLP